MIKLSVCIVTYNNSKSVLKTIETLLFHTKTADIRIYISDNGSTDGTIDEIERVYGGDTRVEVIKNGANIGFGAGHNKILDRLTSDYHLILNPDIIFFEDVVAKLIDYMAQDKNIGISTPKILNIDSSEQFLPKRAPNLKYLIGGRLERFGGIFRQWRSEYTRKHENFSAPVDIEFCTGCFMLIRTSVFLEQNGFDERYFMYFEDADLTREVLKSYKVVFVPEVAVIHEWARMNGITIKYFLIQVMSMIKYIRKWNRS